MIQSSIPIEKLSVPLLMKEDGPTRKNHSSEILKLG